MHRLHPRALEGHPRLLIAPSWSAADATLAGIPGSLRTIAEPDALGDVHVEVRALVVERDREVGAVRSDLLVLHVWREIVALQLRRCTHT
jgi:hypothetical protein